MRRDGVDDPAAEPRHVAAQLDGQEIGLRVEPDDELAALALDLGGEPVAEGERRGAIRRSLETDPTRVRPHIRERTRAAHGGPVRHLVR